MLYNGREEIIENMCVCVCRGEVEDQQSAVKMYRIIIIFLSIAYACM